MVPLSCKLITLLAKSFKISLTAQVQLSDMSIDLIVKGTSFEDVKGPEPERTEFMVLHSHINKLA